MFQRVGHTWMDTSKTFVVLKPCVCVCFRVAMGIKTGQTAPKNQLEFQLTTSHSLIFTVHTMHAPLFKELHSLRQLFIKYT